MARLIRKDRKRHAETDRAWRYSVSTAPEYKRLKATGRDLSPAGQWNTEAGKIAESLRSRGIAENPTPVRRNPWNKEWVRRGLRVTSGAGYASYNPIEPNLSKEQWNSLRSSRNAARRKKYREVKAAFGLSAG